jgi:hypothetical protein
VSTYVDFFNLGKVRNKFPLEMAEIHAPVIAADINDDGKIEMVTADAHGNVAAWTAEGEEIWEVHQKSLDYPSEMCRPIRFPCPFRFVFSLVPL